MSDNIKVAIRVRPLISREQNEKLREQWEVQDNLIYPIDANGKKNGDSYAFDHIFDGNCSNEDIYKTVVHPVVDAAINGFNGTIFAYGQTSSGKTYTMMGDEHEPGLISLAVKNIFLAIQQAVDRKFLLRVSYMEIYNEKVYDLLDIKNLVTIHENTKGVLLNLKEEYTDCPEKVYMVMKNGDKARRIGETSMNEKSSRSHAIFRIIIESSDVKDDKGVVVNVAHLNLVDLAGSERAAQTKATGMRLKEGANINKSLSTLSLVMKQLSESQDFINFRDSKLTRILQPSLGGNALTAIICAVTPAALEETHSTLAFASRAKIVKNKPCLNEVLTDEAVIVRYALQIKKLKKDLEEAKDQAKNQEKLQEKIGRIEKYMIYSSKSTDKKKANTNRRQTWCAPRNREDLPVIYETDILKNQNDILSTIIDSNENLSKEVFPDEFYDLEIESRNLPCTQRKMHHTYSLTRGLSLPSKIVESESEPTIPDLPNIEEIKEDEKTNETGIESKEVVKWLVNETGTPKSVLRDRASYYNNELTALKELTDKEKELLCIEHNKETEKLHSKIVQLENDLKCEKSIKNQLESEKKMIHTKNDELKKKNAELSRINFQLQKEQNKNNDSEYMLEMLQDKFKKREKELLEQLTEARQNQSITTFVQDISINTGTYSSSETSNIQSEAIKKIEAATQSDVPSQVDVASQSDVASQVDAASQPDVASQVDAASQYDVASQVDAASQSDAASQVDVATQSDFNSESDDSAQSDVTSQVDVATQSDFTYESSDSAQFDSVIPPTNVSDESDASPSSDVPPELANKINDYKNKINFIKEELISSDYVGSDLITTFNELNKQSEELSNELSNYSEDIQEQFLTLKSMVQNITYLFTFEKTIKNQELETTKYVNRIAHNQRKELTYEKLVKEQGDEIKHLSNKLLECMQKEQEFQNQLDALEKDLVKSQKTQTDALKKEYAQLISTKDKEIEELSDKIMEYIDLITPLEEDSKKYKELLQKNLDESQNDKIKELNDKLDSCTTQISSLTEELERNKNELTAKNVALEQLKADLEIKSQEIATLHEEKKQKMEQETDKNKEMEINALKDTIQCLTVQLDDKSEILSKLQNNTDSAIDDKNKEIADLLKEQLRLQSEISLKCEEFNLASIEKNSLLHEINEAKKYITEMYEELNVSKTMLEGTREALFNATEEKCELKNTIESLKSIIEQTDASKIENEGILNEMTKKSEILEEKVQNYETQLISKDNKIQHYKNDLCSKKALIKQLSNEIELLNEKILTYESHIDALANQIEEQTKTIESQNKELLELNDQIYKLQEDDAYLNKPSIIINSEAISMTPGKDMAIVNRNDLVEYEIQIKNYKQVCKDQVAELTSLKEIIDSYQSKCENFKATLNVIQDVVITKFGEYIKIDEENKVMSQLIRDAGNTIETLKIQINEKKESSPEILKELIINFSDNLEHFKLNESKFEANELLLVQKRNEVSELNCELANLNEKLDMFKDDIDLLNKEKELLEQQMNEYKQRETEFKSLDVNLEEQDHEINVLTTKLAEAKNQQQLYEAGMENLMSTVKLYQNQIDEYREAEIDNKYESLIRERDVKKESLNQKLMECQEQQINMINNIESLKKQIISQTNELKQLQQGTKLEFHKQLVEEKDQEIAILCDEMLKHEQQLNNYDLDVKILTNILTSFSIFLNDIKNKRSLLDNKIEDLQNTLEQHTQEIVELKNKITSLNNQIQDVTKEKEDFRIEKDCEVNALKETLNEEKHKYEQCTQEITDLNEKITKLNIQVQELIKENENSSNQKNFEIKELKEVFNNEKQKYEQQIQKMKIIQEEFDAIKSENLYEINNALNMQVDQLQKQIQEMNLHEKELEEKIGYFQNVCAEIDTLKSDYLQKEKINIEYNNNIQRLTDDLNKVTLELQSFKDKYTEKENEIETTKQSLETKEIVINKITEELNQKNKELFILNNEITESNLKKDETELKHNKEIQEKLNEIEKLTNKVRTLEKCQLNENFEKELKNSLNIQMDKMEKYKDLIEVVNVYSQKIESCNKAVNLVRSQLETTKNTLKVKEEQLKIILAKILNHMKPKCEICLDVDIETFNKQCNLAFSNNEIKLLRHENAEYKALVTKIRQKANSQIGNFQNILVNVQSENEKLKMNASTNLALIKTLEEKVQNLQTEVSKTSDGNSAFAALQTKIKNLEEENKEFKKMGNYLQEQTTQKINELKEYKKRLEFLKNENTELLKSNAEYYQLKKKLTATEESLKTAQASIKQLEMEKDNFNATSRSLEESLEDVKFELYALKNKERERAKKHKRRSLHDSSRVLSEVDEPTAPDQQEELQNVNKSDEMKQNKENTQINTECDRCKKRENEYQTQDRHAEISKLKDEIKTWKRKYDICKDLCVVRKKKIDQLEIEKRRDRE